MTVRRLNNHPSNSTGKLRHESGNVPQRIRESIYGFRHGHADTAHTRGCSYQPLFGLSSRCGWQGRARPGLVVLVCFYRNSISLNARGSERVVRGSLRIFS